MDIEKKRRRLEVLTQTLEDEKSWTGEGGHEVRTEERRGLIKWKCGEDLSKRKI